MPFKTDKQRKAVMAKINSRLGGLSPKEYTESLRWEIEPKKLTPSRLTDAIEEDTGINPPKKEMEAWVKKYKKKQIPDKLTPEKADLKQQLKFMSKIKKGSYVKGVAGGYEGTEGKVVFVEKDPSESFGRVVYNSPDGEQYETEVGNVRPTKKGE